MPATQSRESTQHSFRSPIGTPKEKELVSFHSSHYLYCTIVDCLTGIPSLLKKKPFFRKETPFWKRCFSSPDLSAIYATLTINAVLNLIRFDLTPEIPSIVSSLLLPSLNDGLTSHTVDYIRKFGYSIFIALYNEKNVLSHRVLIIPDSYRLLTNSYFALRMTWLKIYGEGERKN